MTVRFTNAFAHEWTDRSRLSGRRLPPTFSHRLFVSLLAATRRRPIAPALGAMGVLLLWGAAACAPAVAPPPAPAELPPPISVPVVPPVAAAVVRYTLPVVVTDTRYQLHSVTDLERDSATRRDTQRVSSEAQVVVRLRRVPNGGLSATGRVFGYAVTSALSTTPIAIDSLRFDAVLDAQALRVALQPPLANECDRPESGALAMVRDLLLRVPATVAVGDQWRDSTVQVVCRSSLPMTVRTIAEYVVTDAVRGDDGVHVVVRRSSRTRVAGKSASPWRSVEVTGSGEATLDARISVTSGAVSRWQSTSSLVLTVTDRTSPAAIHAQHVTQRVTLTGETIKN